VEGSLDSIRLHSNSSYTHWHNIPVLQAQLMISSHCTYGTSLYVLQGLTLSVMIPLPWRTAMGKHPDPMASACQSETGAVTSGEPPID